MKPFVTYEKLYYKQSNPLEHLSRRKRSLLEEPYNSAVIKDLSNINVELSLENNLLLVDAIELLIKLDAYVADKFIKFPVLLFRTEALSSSQIEFYDASNRNIALAQLGLRNTNEAKIISNNLNTLIEFTDSISKIDLNYICRIQEALLDDTSHYGIRDKINWISKPGKLPQQAVYVPPHPKHLEVNMNELIHFINRLDIHPLIKAAFSHAYFEVIHPFSDGNGRVGRLLIQIILKNDNFLNNINIPFSVEIVKETKSYISALDQFKLGNYQDIINIILNGAINLVPKIYKILEQIEKIKTRWTDMITERSDSFIWIIIDELVAQPVLNVKYLKEIYDVSDKAIRNNIVRLIDYGILKKVKDQKRNVYYESQEILDLIDSFTKIS